MIEIRNCARVELPDDETIKALVLGMFCYKAKNGESFFNYTYANGVAWLPPSIPKLEVVASILNKKLVDNRCSGGVLSAPYVLNPQFALRDYQEEPARVLLKEVVEKKAATLSAGCGTGKTVVLTHVAGQLNCKVLILVDQSNLVSNWAFAFDAIYGKKIQPLKGKDTSFSDVCITTFQLLYRNPELLKNIRKEFGCVIVDEAHVVSANTFKYVLSRLDTKYRIACSATFFNKNLPTGILEDWLAPVSVKMVDESALVPEVHWVDTGVVWASDEPMDYASYILPALAENAQRNAVIFSVLKKCLAAKRRTIVVCITVNQAKFLHALMVKLGARSEVYTGSTTAKRDRQLKEAFEAGLVDFVFVSKKFDKGTDYPSADALVNCKPSNNLKDAQQITGRVVRKVEGKPKPLIYDFADTGYLAEIFVRNRKKFYKNLNYEEAYNGQK